jgi:hypothetical protein
MIAALARAGEQDSAYGRLRRHRLVASGDGMLALRGSSAFVVCSFALLALAVPQSVENLPEFAKAKEVARQVLDESRALLIKEIAAKGAAGALNACAAVASDLGKKHESEGWRIRRVSEKPRNPADTPDAFEQQALRRFAAGTVTPQTEFAAVSDEQGRRYLRYLKPIVIPGGICLRCHGDPAAMEPEVRETLGKLYPGDKATGYMIGDLRGAVSVRIPMSQ